MTEAVVRFPISVHPNHPSPMIISRTNQSSLLPLTVAFGAATLITPAASAFQFFSIGGMGYHDGDFVSSWSEGASWSYSAEDLASLGEGTWSGTDKALADGGSGWVSHSSQDSYSKDNTSSDGDYVATEDTWWDGGSWEVRFESGYGDTNLGPASTTQW